jgi:hypothetical protein
MDPILLACGGDHDLRQHHHWPGWHLRVSDLVGSSPRPSTARSLLFALDLVAFDPLKNILTLDWWIIGDDCDPGPTSSADSGLSALASPVLNIYVNPWVLQHGDSVVFPRWL